MEDALSVPFPKPGTILRFVAIGIGLYLALYMVSEMLVYRNGHDNPFYKIAAADRLHYDWLIMGASHAMPLAFDTAEEEIEAAAGANILNLALQGVGPLYSDVVLERFLAGHSSAGLIYVVDSFAFRDWQWNEGRLADPGLLARTPLDLRLVSRLTRETVAGQLPPQALLAYVSGLPKINDRDRFTRDVWESAALFDRRYRPSQTATAERIGYLFPEGAGDPAVLDRYLDTLLKLLDRAAAAGMIVRVIKMPVPKAFYEQLPEEAAFDAALDARLAMRGISLLDYSGQLQEPRFYFDSDHLGRQGVKAFSEQMLVPLMNETRDADLASGQGGHSSALIPPPPGPSAGPRRGIAPG